MVLDGVCSRIGGRPGGATSASAMLRTKRLKDQPQRSFKTWDAGVVVGMARVFSIPYGQSVFG